MATNEQRSLVTPEMVKELRERTGECMMHCKKALHLSKGDMDEAVHYLQAFSAAWSRTCTDRNRPSI